MMSLKGLAKLAATPTEMVVAWAGVHATRAAAEMPDMRLIFLRFNMFYPSLKELSTVQADGIKAKHIGHGRLLTDQRYEIPQPQFSQDK
jgi:hypothetical protein